jgi:hypothetical protein
LEARRGEGQRVPWQTVAVAASKKKRPTKGRAKPVRKQARAAPAKPSRRRSTPSKKSSAKKKRVDWSKKRAPPKGSKKRAEYERSAVAKKRRAAAKRGLETRAATERKEQRRLLHREHIDDAKDLLAPLLAKLVSDWRKRRYWSDTRTAHANWYKEKLKVRDFIPERDYDTALEEMSDEADLDDIGWDIIY